MLSLDFTRAMYAEETGDGPIMLLTINHETLTQPIRVYFDPTGVNDPIESRGETYVGFHFFINLPSRDPDSPENVQLEISNVGREIAESVRRINTPATVLIEVVRIKELDEVVFQNPELYLRNVRVDNGTVVGDIEDDDDEREGYPGFSYIQAHFPALFRRAV